MKNKLYTFALLTTVFSFIFSSCGNATKDSKESSVEKKVLEEQYIGSNKNIIVAEETINSRVVGCIFWEVKEDYIRPCKTMYLSYLIVSSDFRRQGIAHLLYKNIDQIITILNWYIYFLR